MTERIDHESFARLLPAASGAWITMLKDVNATLARSRVGNWRPHPRSKRPHAYGRNWDRYEFRTVSNGYGSGISSIQARHVHATLPIPPLRMATIQGRMRSGMIVLPGPEDIELEQIEPPAPTDEERARVKAKRAEIAAHKAATFTEKASTYSIYGPAQLARIDYLNALITNGADL